MTRGDPQREHRQKMRELHALFAKKTQYHKQKAFLELKDLSWLVHEFFTTFLGKDVNFTEEELKKELREFKHDFITIPPAVVSGWHEFFDKLSASQYAGVEPPQGQLQDMLAQFSTLVDQTVGAEYVPQDEFSSAVQGAYVYVKHGEVEKAETTYKKLMARYEGFDADKKRAHYEQLEKLYEAIAGARSGAAAAPR